jgi:UDP-N-acetylmuramoyl-L-alanyl-D-glutamate--2,6-diaminopimelate ligase
MLLTTILYKVPLQSTSGDMNVEVGKLTMDSRQAGPGGLFAAIRGTQTDGHRFIDKAVEQGVSVVLCEEMPENRVEQVTYVQVQESSYALGLIAANFYESSF